jgi:hypothetical protein
MDAEARKAAIGRLTPYVTALQAAMGLAHWRIDLLEDTAPGDCNADVTWWEDKYRADLRLSADFFDMKAEDQRYSITHELLHLHLRGVALVEKHLRHPLGEVMWALIDDRFEHEEELAVDGLARALAPFLPLPPQEGA